MADRYPLSPGTSHTTTKYEVEFYSKLGYWAFDQRFSNLVDAKARKSLNESSDIQSRIIVVSEIRRLVE